MEKIVRIHYTKTSGTESMIDIQAPGDFDFIRRVELLTPKTEDKILQSISQKENQS